MTKRARDIMSHPVTVLRPGMSLPEAARILVADGISGAPVVNAAGRVVGILSRTDIINRAMEGRLSPRLSGTFLAALGLGDEQYGLGEMDSEAEELGTVDDIMSTDPIAVSPDTPLAAVAARMAQHRVHRVLVMDGEELVGIITTLDLISHWPSAQPASG